MRCAAVATPLVPLVPLVSLVLLAVETIAVRSDACSCAAYLEPTSPVPPTKIPTNARVVVTMPRGWPTAPVSDDDEHAPLGNFRLQLRTPATVQKSAIALATRAVTLGLGGGGGPTIELVPEAPLAAQSIYEVWAIDDSPLHASRLVRVVRTGMEDDRTPPAWSGPTHVAYAPAPPPGTLDLCGNGASLEFSGPAATDVGSLHYELWLVPGASVDVGKPFTLLATTWVDPAIGLFSVGESGCSWQAALPLSPALHVGVRAVDWAGNASPLSEIVLDTSPTAKKAKPKAP